MELLGRETARSAVGRSPRSRSESFNSAILTRCHGAGGGRIARSARSGLQGWRVRLLRLTCRAADQPAQPEMTPKLSCAVLDLNSSGGWFSVPPPIRVVIEIGRALP